MLEIHILHIFSEPYKLFLTPCLYFQIFITDMEIIDFFSGLLDQPKNPEKKSIHFQMKTLGAVQKKKKKRGWAGGVIWSILFDLKKCLIFLERKEVLQVQKLNLSRFQNKAMFQNEE